MKQYPRYLRRIKRHLWGKHGGHNQVFLVAAPDADPMLLSEAMYMHDAERSARQKLGLAVKQQLICETS